MNKKQHYFEVTLDVSLKTSDYVFGSINVSHIPYWKLIEIFQDQIAEFKLRPDMEHRFLFENLGGYMIGEPLYQKHKEYLDKEIDFTFDFSLFEYSKAYAG